VEATRQKPELLIVDDDPLITDTLDFVLGRDFQVFAAGSRAQARSLIAQLEHVPRLALVDLGLPPVPHRPDEGFRLIGELLAAAPDIKIIVLSGQNDEANARHARALGAVDFVAKPCEPDVLRQLLQRATRFDITETAAPPAESGIIGGSFAIGRLREQIRQYAASPFPVLIEGESGSGKELVARALHGDGPRAARPYYALNCAAISPTLVEPTLFGYAKGAFTGATAARAGYFEDAAEGTLFLDEIGELDARLQIALLRVLNDGTFRRVGSRHDAQFRGRLVAATNADLAERIGAGQFRQDLYFRLAVVELVIPPLRDRPAEIEPLATGFAAAAAARMKRATPALDDTARAALLAHAWPGNVRELRNRVERAVALGDGPALAATDLFPEQRLDQPVLGRLADVRQRAELDQIDRALALSGGRVSEAAKVLGISRTTLWKRRRRPDTD